jgi:DNA replication protein DnaC
MKPHWTYLPDLVGAVSERGQVASEAFKVSTNAQIEVWDDFGVGGLQGWQIGLLDRIVERRYQWNRPMIVTTNLSRKVLVEQAGPDLKRLTDRWREKGVAITIAGESMRKTWKDDGEEAESE